MTDESPETHPGKRKLGRGLAALFGEDEAAVRDRGSGGGQFNLAVGRLRPGRLQPRRNFREDDLRALVDSIREKGVLQPLLVRPAAGGGTGYEIVAGERRWRAAQAARLHEVPVVVREMDDSEALEVALVENLQREDLTPLEEAEGYKRLMDEFSHSQEQLGRVIGKSRSHIANTLRLLGLPDPVKAMVDDGSLSAGHARALIGAADPLALARQVVRRGLNVRQTERLAAREKAPPRRARRKGAPKDADTLALERDLTQRLGLKVEIALAGEAGNVTIHFEALEQLDDVVARLKRGG